MYTRWLQLLLVLMSTNMFAQHHIRFTKISDGVYVHTSYQDIEQNPFPSNGLLLETEKSVVLVDTPWDIPQTRQLLKWIRKNINKPLTHCIVTHSHGDRVTGVPLLKKHKVKILANQRTSVKMIADGYPQPDIILADDTTLMIDNQLIQAYYPGGGHASDNIVVWLAGEKILFGGCFIKSTQSFGLGNIADANLAEWGNSIKRVEKKFPEARMIIPGHHGWEQLNSPQFTRELLEKNEKKGN